MPRNSWSLRACIVSELEPDIIRDVIGIMVVFIVKPLISIKARFKSSSLENEPHRLTNWLKEKPAARRLPHDSPINKAQQCNGHKKTARCGYVLSF
jgi:hypothetical protein